MKVLYLTVPSFFDLEISLIRELSKKCDVTVMLVVSPSSMHSSAFSVERLSPECKLIKACDYKEMAKYNHLIDLNRWIIANNPDNSFRSGYLLAKEIKKHIRKGGYNLIHSTTNCKTSIFLLPTIWKFKNTLYTVHDPVPHQKKSFISRILTSDLYLQSFKNVLLLSDSLESEFMNNNRGKFKKIFHSGLSIYDFLTTVPTTDNMYGRYILFFGRIDYYKGVDLLVSAFNDTKAKDRGIKLVIAGRMRPGYSVEVNNSNIVFLNRYIDNSELASLIKHSLFVVLPYRSATQSGCVFSAYAFNKPILATKVGDIPKQVTETTGHLIAPDNQEAIKDGINYMFETDLSLMSDRIRIKYSGDSEYSWTGIASKLADDYNKIAGI